ncbi:MAG: capsular biosynthesis protein [Alphaproteobacteria bacterium]|jgi:NDP-sugar pyrophosphorylase family protein|nr:capsular biosynthesis protein [Alphaproteobacteria bacterium]
MQIIIPLTGYGSRFVAAGYKDLKPFINVLGMPILQWITQKMFPLEQDIIFICRQEHLDTIPNMRNLLLQISPSAKIFSIDNWEKRGPVFDVLKAESMIDDKIPAIINYCDFYSSWNWSKVKQSILERDCDGAIPCYTGFHPHLLIAKNVYASCKVDEQNNLIEIKEKFSFETDKQKSLHSAGTYYFKSGALLKKYCQLLVDNKIELNGEYYASLPYNAMVDDGLKVWVPNNIDYFCQWGTPEDLEESLFWINKVRGFKK